MSEDDNPQRLTRAYLRIAGWLALPSVLTATCMLLTMPDRLVFLPLMPLVPIVLLLDLFVCPGLPIVLTMTASFLIFGATTVVLGRFAARPNSLFAQPIAFVLGLANAMLLPYLVQFLG